MNTLTIDSHLRIEDVEVDISTLRIDLSDGRSVSAPLVWYPRLLNGTAKERRKWQLIGDGLGIHWPELDEDLSMEGILQGKPSFESAKSFQKWAAARKKKGLATRWS
jgi:hypothetical protein